MVQSTRSSTVMSIGRIDGGKCKKYTTLHPHVEKAFLLIVMVISILAFSFLEG